MIKNTKQVLFDPIAFFGSRLALSSLNFSELHIAGSINKTAHRLSCWAKLMRVINLRITGNFPTRKEHRFVANPTKTDARRTSQHNRQE